MIFNLYVGVSAHHMLIENGADYMEYKRLLQEIEPVLNPLAQNKNHKIIWLNQLYNKKSFKANVQLEPTQPVMHTQGRACCGGRQLCANQNYKSRHFFVYNRFPDWYCSVNEYFVFIKQVNGEIYTNKDCKMSFDGTVAPIGHLNDTEKLLSYTRNHLQNGTLPIIQCKKIHCICGLCAPKAKELDEFKSIMLKYRHEK